MTPRDVVRGLAIACRDCSYDFGVLLNSGLPTARRREGRPRITSEVQIETFEKINQRLVVARAPHGSVETVVCIHHCAMVAWVHLLSNLQQVLQPTKVQFGSSIGGNAPDSCFQNDSSLVDVENLFGAALTDDHTPFATNNKPILLKASQRFPYRRPTHLTPIGEKRLDERHSGLELSLDDSLSQHLIRRNAAPGLNPARRSLLRPASSCHYQSSSSTSGSDHGGATAPD